MFLTFLILGFSTRFNITVAARIHLFIALCRPDHGHENARVGIGARRKLHLFEPFVHILQQNNIV